MDMRRRALILAASWLAAAGGQAWAGTASDAPAGAASSVGVTSSAEPWRPSLWITREQRAQRLLDAGHAAQAAQLFDDPRRRAYADARIGRDAEAARLLAPLHDPDSQYNRGNALARLGNLVGALAAYDAALAEDPHDRDVRHNRDLVARVLASRAQQQSGFGSNSQSGRSGQQGGESQSGRSGPQGAGAQSQADARSGKSSASRAGQSPSTGGATPGEEAEQALALDQWLRRIPEDPGGLLRRKFLIEHMERQEGAEP